MSNYKDSLIKPSKIINEELWQSEWENTQHIVASILTGDVNASTIINKLASPRHTSKTKSAFVQYNNVLKTNFILRYINDKSFRHAIEHALNRGEAFNRLYRAITMLSKGQLRGQNEIEMLISDACTRLTAAIIQHYNTTILNNLYMQAEDHQVRDFLVRATSTAWSHINFLGHYQFNKDEASSIHHWLKELRWDHCFKFC